MIALDRRTFIASGVAAGLAATPRFARAAAPTPITITVTHYPEQDYALPVVMAQQLGYLQHEGIELKEIVGSSGGGTTVRNITSGGLLLGEVATPAAIKAILAGEDVRIIAGGVQTLGTICWVVKKDSPIKTIGDLVGKTVGFSNPGSVSESALQIALKNAHVDPAGVKTRAAGGIGENYTLLMTGGLDVAFTVDPLLYEHRDQLRVVFFARQYVPRFLQTVWLASTQTMRERTPFIAGFLRARAKGVDYVVSHPIQAAQRYAKLTNGDQRASAVTLAQEQPASYFGHGELDQNSLALIVESMRIGKLLGSDKVDLPKLVDQSAQPAGHRSRLSEV